MKTRSQTLKNTTLTKAIVSGLIAKPHRNEEEKEENIKLVFDISYDEIPHPNIYPYPTVFDFDDSSREWRRNKQSMGNGTYMYKEEEKEEQIDDILKNTSPRYNLRPSRYRPLVQ